MDVLACVLSDASGETAEALATAVFAQFEDLSVTSLVFPFCTSEADVEAAFQAIRENAEGPIFLFNSVMLPSVSAALRIRAERAGYVVIDILDPALKAIEAHTGHHPVRLAGLSRKISEEYLHKISSMEFAVRYDDGKDPRGLLRADLVILGVSLSSKTPLSMFLANKGYNVANLPLVPEIPVPAELAQVDPRRLFGLLIQPERLMAFRMKRLERMGIPASARYAAASRVEEELSYARRVFEKMKATILDVTDQAIESTAALILEQARMSLDGEIRRFMDVSE